MTADSAKEEIKLRLDIVQLVSEYITVKKVGVRHVALCPFHHEKTPSFSLSSDRQFYHCFGCGEHGDVFDFVMKMDGQSFPEALKALAQKAGVKLKEEDVQATGERSRLIELNRLAARFWHEVMMNHPAGERGKAYAAKRALADATCEAWLIGYAPDSWTATMNFLRQHGYRDDELLRAGLALRSERTGGLFDRFRGRFMFPIADAHGSLVGFTGRILPGADGAENKAEAKYMNTPQTPLYDKGRIVFGLHRAKQAIRKAGSAVLVEGNMDVIASHQAGVENVVASSGTALTEHQLRQLKRFTDRLVLAFDIDTAGENAARRGVELALAEGFTVRVLSLPPEAGKDADDAIRRDVRLWTQAIEDAKPYLEWFIVKIKARTDMTDAEAKRRAADELTAEVAKLPSSLERSHWIRQIGNLFADNQYFGDLELAVERMVTAATRKAAKAARTAGQAKAAAEKEKPPRPRTRWDLVSRDFVSLLARWPDLLALAELVPAELLAAAERPLYTALLRVYNEKRHGGSNFESPSDWSAVVTSASHDYPDAFATLGLLAEREYGELTDDARAATIRRLIGEIKELHLSRERRELTDAMAEAERLGDEKAIENLQAQLNALLPGARS